MSIILKFIYLSIAAGLGVASIKYKNISNRKIIMPALLFLVAYCFAFWGVSSLFHSAEGYPSPWFFYLTTVPLWIAVAVLVINIRNK